MKLIRENNLGIVALITGITRQDGTYLAKFLLNKEEIVHGIKRRTSSFNTARIDHLYRDPHKRNVNFFMHYGDMTKSTNLIHRIQEVNIDDIHNISAQDNVQSPFETPASTINCSEAYGIFAYDACFDQKIPRIQAE